MEDAPREPEVEIPPALEPGVYAHALSAWYTMHEFTLDFAVLPRVDLAPYLAVARVRVPARLMFHVIRILNAQLNSYEQRFGEIDHQEQPW